MNIEDDKKGAAVKFPPPLIFLLLLLAGYGLQHFWPISIGGSLGLKYIGGGVVMLGVGIVILVAQSLLSFSSLNLLNTPRQISNHGNLPLELFPQEFTPTHVILFMRGFA
jgi:hypothetical protein